MIRRKAFLFIPVAVALALVASACGRDSSAEPGAKPDLSLAYFQGSVAGPEAIIVSNEDLASKVDATIKLGPVDSGVAGLAQIKGGAFQGISGVGNPPAVAAIGNNTAVDVVLVESLDSAGLVVDDTIKSDADLVGQEIGALTGSTLDFEVRGWLTSKNLTDQVPVRAFQKEADIAAAFKTGSLHAAYISQSYLLDLKAHSGRVVVTAADIAKLGYAALGLLVVTHDYAQQNPIVVQQLVCQTLKAEHLALGPDAARYVGAAAGVLGVKPEAAIEGSKDYPYIPDSEQLAWFKGADGAVTSGRLVDNFTKVGAFLVAQQRLAAVPTADVLAARLDPRFAEKALAPGGCPA